MHCTNRYFDSIPVPDEAGVGSVLDDQPELEAVHASHAP